MKKSSKSRSAFFNPRVLFSFFLCSVGVFLALISFFLGSSVSAQGPSAQANSVMFAASYKNDVSRPLRDLPPCTEADRKAEHEANENPKVPYRHHDEADRVIQGHNFLGFLNPNVPGPLTNFDGIPYPGVGCNCAPPDTNGAIGQTQYVQIVNEGFQVFDKSGNSLLGPNSISSIWTGFGGACEIGGAADLDGPTLPPAGAPATFVGFPGQSINPNYTTYHFHVDFATPGNSTFTTFANPPAAGFTALCPSTRACVPQSGVASSSYLDGIGDRLMFRLGYRNFGDHESVVGNCTVSANGVAGIRWFELRNVTNGPVTVFQQSTYQPDTTWRWMGSAAMDGQGNIAT